MESALSSDNWAYFLEFLIVFSRLFSSFSGKGHRPRLSWLEQDEKGRVITRARSINGDSHTINFGESIFIVGRFVELLVFGLLNQQSGYKDSQKYHSRQVSKGRDEV